MVRVYRPGTLKEALEFRKKEKVIPFAGGTDLMVKRRRWSGLAPQFDAPVLFLSQIDELKRVEKGGNKLIIGALCTLTELLENDSVPEILKLAIREMASPAIRNIATIGGNISNASPAGDTLPPLYALDASLVLQSLEGERRIKIDEFIKGPGETILHEDELLTYIVIPLEEFNTVFYRKVGTRKANALSKLSFAGLARVRNNVIEDVRISFGAVAPTPVRARELEVKIKGKKKEEIPGLIPELKKEYGKLIKPIDDQRSTAKYRKTISLRLLEHFLKEVIK